jgi:hypothetical protein
VHEVHYHKEPNDKEFNEITVIMRDRAKKNEKDGKYQRIRIPVLQNFLGGHCGGYNWNPRRGDMVYCFFFHERKGLCLGNYWGWAEYPICRPSPYDIADKNGQWMEPVQDGCGDFEQEPYPELKKPYCDRWFHGPPKGSCGKGRDHKRVFDYCQEGDGTPDCHKCKTIDSIGRSRNWWDAHYSHETESCQAPPKRDEKHVYCGSYLRYESETGQSEEYSEGCGHIRLGNATCEAKKKGHVNWDPKGSIDIHSVHEEVDVLTEHKGTRVIAFAPDSGGEIAVAMDDFESGAFVHIMKNGDIQEYSPGVIYRTALEAIIDTAPVIEQVTLEVHNFGNEHIEQDEEVDGVCSGPNNNV